MIIQGGTTTSKTELIPFQTSDVTREQFLRGDRRDKPAWIAGELRIPQARGRRPAAILLHGSSGIRANVNAWAEQFVNVGVASFVVDSFSGRGIGGTDSQQSRLSATAMIVDAFNARKVLANHPRIDRDKLLLMGLSKGGTAALYASMQRFAMICGAPKDAFAGYVALYPFCATTFLQEEDVADRPIRVYHGDLDDVTPIEASRRYLGKLVKMGRDAQLIELQGAHHLFDLMGQAPLMLPNLPNMSRCFTEERQPGVIVNSDTGELDGPDDPRTYLGATLGYSAAATARAVRSVLEFCDELFGGAGSFNEVV
jgi:dienelactone hydrolase